MATAARRVAGTLRCGATAESPTHTTSGPAPAVLVNGLVKRYGEIEAVRGIELEVGVRETFGFLGLNGAGKSTTLAVAIVEFSRAE